MDDLFRCSMCEQYKLIEEFSLRTNGKPASRCKLCAVIWVREYRLQNPQKRKQIEVKYIRKKMEADPEAFKIAQRTKYLLHSYNITPEQYDSMWESQGGLCGICKKSEAAEDRRLSVDHDKRCCPGRRSCGKCIRGLLCTSCNTKLGWVEIFFLDLITWTDRRVNS